MLQALKANQRRARVAVGRSVPAPVEGWDAVSPLASMDPLRAVVLDNWFPQAGYVEIRKGYTSHSTGMGSSTPVQTLMVYNGLTAAANKMFGIAGGTIYDCSSAAAASSVGITSLSSSRWQYVNFTTAAGVAYLWCCSGADAPRHYNGSAWASPSITGVTGTDIINVNVHKNRIWGILTGGMDACYFPTDSVAGAGTKFPLGRIMSKGGFLVAMGTWTRDGGSGPDDLAVFVSSKGQVAIFQGTDPAADWTHLGTFDLAPPLGYRCLVKTGGDMALITQEGVLPLSKALPIDQAAEKAIAMTQRINNAMNIAARSYGSNFGWQLVPYPKGSMVILNVPISENSEAHQYVMNSLTGAWCRFKGWNANCFAVYNDALYFGSNVGVVYKADNGGKDGTSTIDAIGQTAYNYFKQFGISKDFTALQPLITTDIGFAPALGISTDFKSNESLGTPTTSSNTGAVYGTAVYGTDVYAVSSGASADWTTVGGIGQCASIHFRAQSSATTAPTIEVNGFNITYQAGEFY